MKMAQPHPRFGFHIQESEEMQQAIRTAPVLRHVTSALRRHAPLARQLGQAWGEAPGLVPSRTLKGWTIKAAVGPGKAGGQRGMALRCPTRPTILEDQERAAVMPILLEHG